MNGNATKDRRLQEIPDLRDSVEKLLAFLGEQLKTDENAVLVAHVERTSTAPFSELAPFRERFLQDLPPAQEVAFRKFGTFIWRLLFNVEEINLPGGPPRQPASYVRDDVKRLSAEDRGQWTVGCPPSPILLFPKPSSLAVTLKEIYYTFRK